MKHSYSRLILLIGAGLLLRWQPVQAQKADASLEGTVQDIDGKGRGPVAVTVVHLPSGIQRAASVDARGHFALAGLVEGGPYMVKVSQDGYRAQVINNVYLLPGRPSNLLFRLTNHLPPAPPLPKPGPATPPTDPKATASLRPMPVLPAAPSPRASADDPYGDVTDPASSAAAAAPARRSRPYSGAARPPAKGVAPAVNGHYDAKSGNYIYETGALTTLKLPNGTVVKEVGVKSTESLLNGFLADATQQVDTVDLTKGWLNFDRVYFEPGRATLTPASMTQLRNVVAIMKAYPHSRVKIGGYTDSTGTYRVNRELSEARARAAWAALLEMGIRAERIEAKGYGPRYAIAPNTTDEGRAMNRRLSIKVLQK